MWYEVVGQVSVTREGEERVVEVRERVRARDAVLAAEKVLMAAWASDMRNGRTVWVEEPEVSEVPEDQVLGMLGAKRMI